MRRAPFHLLIWILLLPLSSVPLWSTEGYQLPPKEIVDLIDAPLSPQVQFGPSEDRAVLMQRNFLTSLEELSETELRLAGLRIKPDLDGPSRRSPVNKLRILQVETGEVREISGLPEKLRMIYWQWSPSGDHGSFAQITSEERWFAFRVRRKFNIRTGSCVANRTATRIGKLKFHHDPCFRQTPFLSGVGLT